jgi:hypothetical protein
MTPPDPEVVSPRPLRRLSSGWIVLGGSVLASFVWWLLSPPPKQPAQAPPSVAAPSEPAPAALAPDKPPESPGVKPRVSKAPSGDLESVVSVVHKHRFGSCEGRLLADVGGVRYAPTEGDDAFSAPLGSLETFVVDYQEKRLRLKVKGGKSFTFTTRADNADPLFVFHRDVEKARKKLAGGA